MAHTTIEQFATELKMQAGALLEQLAKAGVAGKREGDDISESDKTKLLEYLQKQHGAAGEPKRKITLTRKQTTEIRAAGSTGKARTIQVEVRKKRVFVKRDETEAAEAPVEEVAAVEPEVPDAAAVPSEPAVAEVPEPVVAEIAEPAAPALPEAEAQAEAEPAAVPAPAPVPTPAPLSSLLSPEEIAARAAEERKAQELRQRQEEDLQRKQAEAARRKSKKEKDA